MNPRSAEVVPMPFKLTSRFPLTSVSLDWVYISYLLREALVLSK